VRSGPWTTTLRILATILKPTSGQAFLNGHEVLAEPEAVRRSLGFYSASTALYPRLTARETLEFFARVNRFPAEQVDERVDALIQRFGIAEYQGARVEKLSSGMKQKVSIARTVVHDPIQELRDEGKCIIFSTHIMSEAERLCDRIGVIHRGRLLALGTLDEHRERTGHHYLEDIFVQEVLAVEQDMEESSGIGATGELESGS
jgi:sodium transport system ATP-binding protein